MATKTGTKHPTTNFARPLFFLCFFFSIPLSEMDMYRNVRLPEVPVKKVASLFCNINCNFLKKKLSLQSLNFFLHLGHYTICMGCLGVRHRVTGGATFTLIEYPKQK